MKRILSILLLTAILLSAFLIPVFAETTGDDNATSGDGSTNDAAKGYAWYNSKQYLWKVTLFVGKSDQVSKQSSLTNNFYRIGTVVMKKDDWTVPAAAQFADKTKVDYYSGATLSLDDSPYIISDKNCPAVPIACDGGNIETVKAYFGSTGTVSTVLSGIAADKGTSKEGLLSSLSFSIGGQVKTGWDFSYVNPNATTNRVPWVIVYEPMILMNLKDKETKLALTATEFALCQLNGWYDWSYNSGEGQGVSSLTCRHLPTSVQLEESWFGYPVYAVTDDTQKWAYEDVVKGGGWGMRWLDIAVRESPELMDFGCYFSSVNTTPTAGTYGTVNIVWRNYEDATGTVLCELYRGSRRVWSERKTIEGGSSVTSSLSLYYSTEGTETLTAYINWEFNEEETDPGDNMRTITVNVQPLETPNTDFGVSITSVEQPNQDAYGTVTVRWRNWETKSGSALCELYLDNVCIWSGTKMISANSYVDSSYEVYYSGTSAKTLEARINYANKDKETDPSDNRVTKTVTPTRTTDDTFDFSVSGISVTPSTLYQGEDCTITFIADNWNRDVAYKNVYVELLVGGKVVKAEYASFNAYGRIRYTYTIPITGLGTQTVTARINWPNRSAEDNQSNNSVSTTVTTKKNYDFYVYNLSATPTTCYELETVKVTFATKNLDVYNAYEDVAVELLLDGKVLNTEKLDYPAGGGFNHTWTVNVGNDVGKHTLVARVNWGNKTAEKNANNNLSGSVTYTVKELRDLSVQAITPNSSYTAGTTVITSFYIVNSSRHDVLPSHNNTVNFRAYYYNNGSRVTISSQSWKQAVIPAYGYNLVYFKWTVPASFAGKTIYCDATVNAGGNVGEKNTANNTATLTRTVISKKSSQTPDTQFEKEKPEGYTIPSLLAGKVGKSTWSMWAYEDGAFVKKSYGVSIALENTPSIQPDVGCPNYKYVGGKWQMGSGYGISLNYVPKVTNPSGYLMPDSTAYTGIQQAFALFPEFGYSGDANKFRTLQNLSGNWMFYANTNTNDNARLHFTPLWYPLGDYTISVLTSDLWTPAGMVVGLRHSNPIRIINSVYDDWYVGGA